MARLVAAGVELRKQIDRRWPRRDRRTDGWYGNADHARRVSDHNPDKRGWVHAIDIDADLDKNDPKAAQRLADQLVAYARSGQPGADRLKYVVYRGRIASGTYKATFWEWRGSGYGHEHHIHVSFTDKAPVTGRRPFPLPILDGKADASGHVNRRP